MSLCLKVSTNSDVVPIDSFARNPAPALAHPCWMGPAWFCIIFMMTAGFAVLGPADRPIPVKQQLPWLLYPALYSGLSWPWTASPKEQSQHPSMCSLSCFSPEWPSLVGERLWNVFHISQHKGYAKEYLLGIGHLGELSLEGHCQAYMQVAFGIKRP